MGAQEKFEFKEPITINDPEDSVTATFFSKEQSAAMLAEMPNDEIKDLFSRLDLVTDENTGITTAKYTYEGSDYILEERNNVYTMSIEVLGNVRLVPLFTLKDIKVFHNQIKNDIQKVKSLQTETTSSTDVLVKCIEKGSNKECNTANNTMQTIGVDHATEWNDKANEDSYLKNSPQQ